MGRRLIWIMVSGFFLSIVFKWCYSLAAANGYLGYDAQEKYIRQTRVSDSSLALLMAGRMEFFCGVMACLDRPILGFGPFGEDRDGYVERYLNKYATDEDYRKFIKVTYERVLKRGDFYRVIPTHSHIAMFWVYYGLPGLFVWLYVLWMMFRYYRKDAHVVPHWYGFMAVTSGSVLWDIFFSPFAGRILIPTMICCMLFARAIQNRKICLPYEMEMEARKYD